MTPGDILRVEAQAKVVNKLSSMFIEAQKAHIVGLEAAIRDQVPISLSFSLSLSHTPSLSPSLSLSLSLSSLSLLSLSLE